ncbi:MAG: thioesterase family protein [Burkholderiales bacterium]|nr:thioesterase family protein [Burkholderiales bacterium]
MTAAIETYRGFVYPWTIDHVGHMNVQSYTARFDEASWQFLAHLGLTPSFLRDNRRGLVALDQRSRYQEEVLAGSLLDIRTTLLEAKTKTLRYRHAMRNSETGREVATMELVVAYLDTDARKATAMPDFVAARAADLMSAGEPACKDS